jgi:large subunit ribosomal protein L15
MTLTELSSKLGKKKTKRVGRGNASGHGTYSCRGMKGQSARTGGRRRPGFEGGQTPYLRKMPKLKGFKNPNYIEYQIVNLSDLSIFDDKATVDTASLYEKKLISKKTMPVKILGTGDLTKALTVTAHKASKSAIEKIEKAKGSITILTQPKEKKAKKEKAPEAPAKEEATPEPKEDK